ncbi:GtrA family protein [Antrihabitans sp. NCIMB 15449]|uniref:GtrA family protein n=1 Tax=Antrihabitans spumae TaxID=3373370 RepID=A0ABW7JP88_9NOCA
MRNVSDDDPGVPTGSGAATPPPGLLSRVVRSQSVAYVVVGCVNTAIGFGLFVVWMTVLGDDDLYAVAVAAAYSMSIVIAFVLHRTLVFRVRGHLLRDFVGFVGVNAGGFVLNLALMALAVSIFRFAPIPSQFVVTGIVAATSYFGHRHVSFRRAPAPPGDAEVVLSRTRG